MTSEPVNQLQEISCVLKRANMSLTSGKGLSAEVQQTNKTITV